MKLSEEILEFMRFDIGMTKHLGQVPCRDLILAKVERTFGKLRDEQIQIWSIIIGDIMHEVEGLKVDGEPVAPIS